ncbi:MAG: FAD-dependent oxidoreductase [Candidatus Brocadiia bacterium]
MIEYNRTDESLEEPARTLSVADRYDVIVAGGGMAGVGAGIAAARQGCETLIIEQTSALGGLATVGLVTPLHDYLSGIGQELMRNLKDADAIFRRASDPQRAKLVLDRMVDGAGCDLLLVTYVVEAIVENGEIRGVVVESKSGREAILAKRVIDCSGDADVAARAGCECMVGRSSDGLTQACSMDFRVGGVNWEKYSDWDVKAEDPRWTDFIKKAVADGRLPYEIDNHLNWMTRLPDRPEKCGQDEVCICFAHSRDCHPLNNKDLTRMYMEGRQQCEILLKFLRNNVPGFEQSFLTETAMLLGVRDSRRVVGQYVLTGWDVASFEHFDDVIAVSQHAFDIHNPDGPGNIKWIEAEIDGEKRYVIGSRAGFGTTWEPPGGKDVLSNWKGQTGKEMEFPKPIVEEIPYRSLVPRDVDNMLVAGRCLSADFEAQSCMRLIMCCMAMGEAAGTASALSLKNNVSPREVDVTELQKILVENGGNIGQDFREIPGLDR